MVAPVPIHCFSITFFSDDFQEKVGVHQGSAVLSPQLFNIICFVTVDGKVPAVCLYKEIVDALDRGTYKRLNCVNRL